ncbi:hypothetical protein DFH94DRAFT_696749 [Russula ochroleuca]|uniref:Uncharacterized protein n=1 Tax=Russula ochroleuca TaxID=152965 RepID=A0A9P5JYS7_9AGAM|nr:hypothetical protein DFH94DRAFT_696749 [Russula ochroleuca]
MFCNSPLPLAIAISSLLPASTPGLLTPDLLVSEPRLEPSQDLATATGASHAGDVTGLPLPLHFTCTYVPTHVRVPNSALHPSQSQRAHLTLSSRIERPDTAND